MRKIVSTVFIVFMIFGITCTGTAYADTGALTVITGYVTKHTVPMAGMTVIASCGRYFADSDVTDTSGAYLTTLPAWQCGWGSGVELIAISSTDLGSAYGMTYKVTSKLNIANTPITVDSE